MAYNLIGKYVIRLFQLHHLCKFAPISVFSYATAAPTTGVRTSLTTLGTPGEQPGQ